MWWYKLRKGFLLFLLFTFLTLSFQGISAFASTTLTISPALVELNLDLKNSSISKTVTITNNSDYVLTGKIELQKVIPNDLSGVEIAPFSESDNYSSWFVLSQKEYNLKPSEFLDIDIVFTPKNVKTEGFYVAIVCTNQNSTNVSTSLASLIFIRSKIEEISNFNVSVNLEYDKNSGDLKYFVNNQNNINFVPSGILYIGESFKDAEKVFDFNPQKSNVLPGQNSQFIISSDQLGLNLSGKIVNVKMEIKDDFLGVNKFIDTSLDLRLDVPVLTQKKNEPKIDQNSTQNVVEEKKEDSIIKSNLFQNKLFMIMMGVMFISVILTAKSVFVGGKKSSKTEEEEAENRKGLEEIIKELKSVKSDSEVEEVKVEEEKIEDVIVPKPNESTNIPLS